MTTSNTITKTDLTNILNEVLPVNGAWTLIGTATGSTAVTLPTGWSEIVVVGKFGSNKDYGFSEFFIGAQIRAYAQPYRFFGGNYTSSSDYHNYVINFSTTSVNLYSWNWRGTNVLSTSSIYVWGR